MPPSLFKWTQQTKRVCETQEIAIEFNHGVPVAVDGRALPLLELIAHLNVHVGAFTIGRYSGLEHLERGEKVLEVREAPAATVLMDAYRHLETAILDAELLREKISVEQMWTREAVEGRWYGTLRQSAEAFIRTSAEQISGTVCYVLREGVMEVCSIKAQRPLYLTDRDAWEKRLLQDEFATPTTGSTADVTDLEGACA